MNSADLKEFINHLVKAKKTLRLYPETNPIYEKTVGEIYERLLNLLEDRDEIVLKFRQFEIYSDGELLYQNEDKHESFAMFFFKDGLRELKFLKGIPKEEFADFLKIISTDFEREVLDDDVVTLMWERDFQHIHYVVDENLFLEDEGPYDEEEIERVKGVTTEESILEAYRDAFEARPTKEGPTIVSLTNEDVKAIVEELEKEPEEVYIKFVYLLFEMLHMADSTKEAGFIVEHLKKTLDIAMDRSRIDVVAGTYTRMVEASKTKEFPKEIMAMLVGVVSHLNSKEFIEIFGHTLEEGVVYEEKEIEGFSKIFDKRAIGPLVDLLGRLESMAARKAVIKLLTIVGRKNIEALVKGLNDPRWYLVRNIINILREIGDKRVAQYVAPLVRHNDRRVRRIAIETIGEFAYSNALPMLKETLYDEEESVRIATVSALARIHTPAAKTLILNEIKDKGFYKKSMEERREFFKALASWKDSEVKEFIIGILKRRAFFGRSKLVQMKTLAAYAAGLMVLKEAEDVLKKLTRAKEYQLREEALEAYKRLRYARR